MSETCRISFQYKFEKLVHLVGFIARICHDARSHERTGLLISLLSPNRLKKQLKVRHFSSDAQVIAAVETRLDGQPYDFFFECLAGVRVWSL